MYAERLKQYLDSKQEEMIRVLSNFVKIASVSSDSVKVGEALDFILNLGRSFGFRATSCLGGQVGVIEIGQGDETLGILSHVDVVEPGDMDQWETDPFAAVVKDGNIYGRGTIDDKGAIVASLYAMRAVCELGLPLHKKIQLILGTQEEVEWTDMKAYVREFPLPDYGFTPDGEFPMCNIEKGSIDIKMGFPLTEAAGEGAYLTSVSAGTASNIVPGICTAEITEYQKGEEKRTTVKALGKAVHSCQPEKGENAIFNMVRQLREVPLTGNKLLEVLNLIEEKLGDIYGAEIGLYSASEYYNGEFVHRNVFAPTIFKVENNLATVNVNVRFAYGTTAEEIIAVFQQLADQNGGRVLKTTVLPTVYVSKDRPFVQAFCQAYDEVSGRKNEFVLAYGGSYAKAMPNIVSWGPIFPEDEDTCHEENEYMPIACLMDNARIFSAAISEIVLSEASYR